MSRILSFSLLCGLLVSIFALQGCNRDECTRERIFTQLIPVYMTEAQIRTPIEVEQPRVLQNPGKIYYYNDWILVNEANEGIHVIDNTSPENPVNKAFVNIPGNTDMAIKDDVLYANNVMDLLAFDFSTPTAATLLNRAQDVFPTLHQTDDGSILAYYDQVEVTEMVDCNGGCWWGGGFMLDAAASGAEFAATPNGTGVGGSMARFTLYDNYLYTVDETTLRVFDIHTLDNPTQVSDIDLGWGIETIYPYGENLFIGSTTGMFIFDNSNPANPTQLSRFAHVMSCDPVVVKDNYAYVTLRGGTRCRGFTNQLDLLDISNLSNPVLKESFPMDNPHGLAIHENALFLCEGDDGIKVFDIEDPLKLDKNQIDRIRELHAFDAIALPNGLLMVIGDDGLYQYDHSNPKNLEEVSRIPVE